MPRHAVCLNPDDPKQNFENENLDFCRTCWPPDVDDLPRLPALRDVSNELIARSLRDEDMTDGCAHPDYTCDDYRCAICGRPLGDADE